MKRGRTLFEQAAEARAALRAGEARGLKTVSFHAMERARSTIEDFVLSYFHFHGLDPATDLLRLLPLLVWVEASIYQLDEENEQLAMCGRSQPELEYPAAQAIQTVLEHKGLWDDRLRAELEAGLQYWRAERSICARWARGEPVEEDELLAASLSKSFDYRVLHLLLFRLAGQPYDEPLLRLLQLDEHLVDINDDLVDYEKDVHRNSFNIYRGLVKLHGPDQAQIKLIERISRFEAELDKALELQPAERQERYKRRRTDAMHGPSSKKWIVPRGIADEERWRRENGGGLGGDGAPSERGRHEEQDEVESTSSEASSDN